MWNLGTLGDLKMDGIFETKNTESLCLNQARITGLDRPLQFKKQKRSSHENLIPMF